MRTDGAENQKVELSQTFTKAISSQGTGGNVGIPASSSDFAIDKYGLLTNTLVMGAM